MNQQQYDVIKQTAYNDELDKISSWHPARFAGSVVRGASDLAKAIRTATNTVRQEIPAAAKRTPSYLKEVKDREIEIARVNYLMGKNRSLKGKDLKTYLTSDLATAAQRKHK